MEKFLDGLYKLMIENDIEFDVMSDGEFVISTPEGDDVGFEQNSIDGSDILKMLQYVKKIPKK